MLFRSSIGGTIYSTVEIGMDDDDNPVYIPGPGAITEDNYHMYIYGTEVSAEVAARYELLSEAPTVTLPARLPVTE